MNWLIANTQSGRPLNGNLYLHEHDAKSDLARLGRVFESLYRVIPHYQDIHWQKILLEGFRPGDLEGILLPQFSVDVYVPGDADTDNIVVGFLIKGVPEAVFPFKNFCTFTRGVKHVDYGDSDTLPHTSIVYVEFDREQFDVADFEEMIEQICRLGGMKSDDMSVNFPNSNKVFPYSLKLIEKYFNKRNVDRNRLEQWKANDSRAKQIQKEIEQEMDDGAIAHRLGGHAAGGDKEASGPHSFRRLKRPNRLARGDKQKVGAAVEIPETIKASIRAEAQRNRTNHQFPWKDFDMRWAQRLHTTPNKIASIRKQIYGGKG